MALRDALGVLVRDQPSDVGGSSAKAGHIEGGQSWQPAALLTTTRSWASNSGGERTRVCSALLSLVQEGTNQDGEGA